MPEQAKHWQQKLDAEFPSGLIITSGSDAPSKLAFPAARPLVVGMRGLNPVVLFELHGHERSLVFEIRDWQEEQANPRLVRVTTGESSGPDVTVLLSGNVSKAHAEDMAAERRQLMRASYQAWEAGQ